MKMTLKSLIESTSIPESLVRAVVRQSGGWESFAEKAPDVSRYGASGGFSGWIYYTETQAFTRRNRQWIADYAEDMAKDLGEAGAVALVKGFNCFRSDPPTESAIACGLYGGRCREADELQQVENALAWFALEEVCHAFCNLSES